MAITFGPQDSANFTQAQWQKMFQVLFTDGVILNALNGFTTTTTSGLGISVASGDAMIRGFLFESDAAIALTATAADPSNPRLDLVVIHCDLSAHTADVRILAGTPAPSPVAPALTQTATIWESTIYELRVNAGSATINVLSDLRIYATAAIGPAAITAVKIANSAVGAAQIATGAVGSAQIADGSIATADIANAAITDALLAKAKANVSPSGVTIYVQQAAPSSPVKYDVWVKTPFA